ncbi:MAG: CapA family protein [Chloroflexota bacterium]
MSQWFSRICLLGIISLLGVRVNAQITSDCDASVGTTERQSYRSSIAQTTMYYTVYLPPCYDNTNTYPTLYLMHGSASFDDHWLQIGLAEAMDTGIADGSLPEMIAVLPFGEWIANENQFERVSFANVFLEELMPTVAENYAVAEGRNQRAIGGISRGGFWAFHIGLKHPDLFAAVGGHSAFFDRFHASPEHNPLDLALNAPDIDTLAISLDRGANDYASPGLDLMDERLLERGVAYTYTVHPSGEHDNRYWSAHITDYLLFYAEAFSEGPLTPTPPDPASFTFSPPRATPDPLTFDFTPPRETTAESAARELFVPVVAFNSTRSDMNSGDLWNLLAGASDENLWLDDETIASLATYDIALSPARTTTRAELERALWNDREAYSFLPWDAVTTRYRVLHIDGEHPLLRDDLDGYPLAIESDTPNFDPSALTTLTLSGVTAITRNSIAPIDAQGVEWAANGIADFTSSVDYFHTSNEVSFTDSCPSTVGIQQLGAFCSKTAHFDVLELANVDIVELSGNHNNDYGYDAYRDTLALYRENGIQTIGGGETEAEARQPLILAHQGNTIAMLACNDAGPFYAVVGPERPGAAACGPWLQDTMTELQGITDLIVVTVQHVEFEEYEPRPAIEFDFRQIADWGADVVAGTHAHKPQTFEFYNTVRGEQTLLHYGLGNLFFDQPFWGNSRF